MDVKESVYAWREKNPERYKEIQKKAVRRYRKAHRKKVNQISLDYYYKHRKEVLRKAKEKRDAKKLNMEGKDNDIL